MHILGYKNALFVSLLKNKGDSIIQSKEEARAVQGENYFYYNFPEGIKQFSVLW